MKTSVLLKFILTIGGLFLTLALHAQTVSVISAPTLCTAPFLEKPTNFVANANFAVLPTAGPKPANTPFPTGVAGVTWSAGVPYAGNGTYPGDTSVAIHSGTINFFGGVVQQQPFPGDPARGVAGSNTYLYANGNSTGAPYLAFRQTITGLSPNRTYVFSAYASNAIVPGTITPDLPTWQFRACSTATCTAANNLGGALVVPNDPAGQDIWRLIQRSYTTGPAQTSLTLELLDSATGVNGDDGVITQINLRECAPRITLQKSWTDAVVGNSVAISGTGLTPFTSVANTATETDVGTAQPVSVGSAVVLSENFLTGAASQYASSLACTGTSGLIGNTLTVGAADTAIVCTFTNKTIEAALTISKTDSKTIATSGGSNNYVLTLSNAGPAAANGVVVTDVVGAGLVCPATNTVSCSVTAGAAVCPAGPLTFANLLSGITISTFPINSTIQFAYVCNVN